MVPFARRSVGNGTVLFFQKREGRSGGRKVDLVPVAGKGHFRREERRENDCPARKVSAYISPLKKKRKKGGERRSLNRPPSQEGGKPAPLFVFLTATF